MLQRNRLSELPSSIASLTNSLSVLGAHNNNISRISSNFSTLWPLRPSLVLTLGSNPSSCVKAIQGDMLSSVYCDCAAGYFGITSCEPMTSVFTTPALVSARVGYFNGQTQASTICFSTGIADPPVVASLIFVDPISQTVQSQLIPVVCSAFTSDPEQPCERNLTISTSVGASNSSSDMKLSNLCVNTDAPSDIRYRTTPATLPAGIAIANDTAQITVLTNVSGVYTFTVTAEDLVTKEELFVGSVVVDITDCGPNVCLNGGTCVDDADAHNGQFSCACPIDYLGSTCEIRIVNANNEVRQSFPTVPVAIGAGVAGFLILCLLLFALSHWLYARRLRRIRKIVDAVDKLKLMKNTLTELDKLDRSTFTPEDLQSIVEIGNYAPSLTKDQIQFVECLLRRIQMPVQSEEVAGLRRLLDVSGEDPTVGDDPNLIEYLSSVFVVAPPSHVNASQWIRSVEDLSEMLGIEAVKLTKKLVKRLYAGLRDNRPCVFRANEAFLWRCYVSLSPTPLTKELTDVSNSLLQQTTYLPAGLPSDCIRRLEDLSNRHYEQKRLAPFFNKVATPRGLKLTQADREHLQSLINSGHFPQLEKFCGVEKVVELHDRWSKGSAIRSPQERGIFLLFDCKRILTNCGIFSTNAFPDLHFQIFERQRSGLCDDDV